jgi:sugar lactone lactonase YvrE
VGLLEGDANETFGDLRGIEADSAGNIYVLDHQTSEIRAFDPEGRYLRTLTRKGEGPGELSAANGMLLTDRGTLWVQDHGQWRMIELTLEGEEIRRYPMHVLSYSYVWTGTVDDRGRFWKPTSHSDQEQTYPPEVGLNEGSSRQFMKWFDPATEETDSVFLGASTYRTFINRNSRGGHTYRGVPFAPRGSAIVDPAGGFWVTSGEAHRIARLNERADTVLVVNVDIPPETVTAEDRQAYVEVFADREPEERRVAEELAALAHPTKSVIDQLNLDDEGRLWVRRLLEEGQTPVYDVLDRKGEFLGSVRLGFRPMPYLPPRIRGGSLYAVVADELDVQTFVRANLPPLGPRK